MSEHTPGPWRLWAGPKGAFQITKDDGAVLASRNDWGHRSLESMANARLIAAAPDLLKALEDCVLLLEIIEKTRNPSWDRTAAPTSVIGEARAAIAKATGK